MKTFLNFIFEKSNHISDNLYSYKNTKSEDVVYLTNWMNKKGIYFDQNTKNKTFRILVDPQLESEESLKLRELIDDFDIYKIWENVATLGNTPGMGSVTPPTSSSVGSGDVFVSGSNKVQKQEDEEDDEMDQKINEIINKLKRKLIK